MSARLTLEARNTEEEKNMDTFDTMQAKYEAMERATTAQEMRLAHDAGNIAMQVVASEMGLMKMAKRFFPSES